MGVVRGVVEFIPPPTTPCVFFFAHAPTRSGQSNECVAHQGLAC
jgi:hypothetical protein